MVLQVAAWHVGQTMPSLQPPVAAAPGDGWGPRAKQGRGGGPDSQISGGATAAEAPPFGQKDNNWGQPENGFHPGFNWGRGNRGRREGKEKRPPAVKAFKGRSSSFEGWENLDSVKDKFAG